MRRVEEYHLHPLGWEKDPESERFKLHPLDYLSTITYINNALFFEVKDGQKRSVLDSEPVRPIWLANRLTLSAVKLRQYLRKVLSEP